MDNIYETIEINQKPQIIIDLDNIVIGWATIGSFENGIEVETLPEDIEVNKYKYLNGNFILNPSYKKVSIETQNKINELKALLFSTDYQAIKYAEGAISFSDYSKLKEQRQKWRDEINRLEQENNYYVNTE